MKRSVVTIFLALFPVFEQGIAWAATPVAAVLRCVVIDAGHGGKDPGAVGNGAQEKAINLGIALQLGEQISRTWPDVRVVYTRSDDRFIELEQRSKIASRAGADLFISIHTNASTNRQAFGTETFVMGEDKGNRNLSVVMRENSVISLEANYSSRYEGYDPNSSESVILFSLMQYTYQAQSLALAELIQNQYTTHARRSNKGVKQAGFLVLWRTPMPSILTEVGFISNPNEARYLSSVEGQQQMATSLFRAVAAYREKVNSRTLATLPSSATATPAGSTAPVNRNPVATSPPSTIATAVVTQNPVVVPATPAVSDSVVFRIQVKSSGAKIPITTRNFGGYAPDITEKKIVGRYKYFCNACFSYQEALLLQREIREVFPDAFIVAFRGDIPVPLVQVVKP